MVVLFPATCSGHTDSRRTISDIVLPEDFTLPFAVRQIKVVAMTDEAVTQGLVVGNHYHVARDDPSPSRWEVFVVSGKFRFRFRPQGEEAQEVEMKTGDACLIPPGNSHAFLPLEAGSQLWGISNLPHNADDDVPDKLF